jgi:hypothetical protein
MGGNIKEIHKHIDKLKKFLIHKEQEGKIKLEKLEIQYEILKEK